MSYPNPNQHQYAQHYAAQQHAYAARQQMTQQQQQQQQRAMQAGRGGAAPHPAAAAAGRYGPGPAGMMQGYPPQARNPSPRGRGAAPPSMPNGGRGGAAPPGMPANSGTTWRLARKPDLPADRLPRAARTAV